MEPNMGAHFEVAHANFVGYLTAGHRAAAPRADESTLKQFLCALAEGKGLISSSQGTPHDWVDSVREAAKREAPELSFSDELLEPKEVARRLDPLRTYFTEYALYVFILPSQSADGARVEYESFRFFAEAAVSSHSGALVLMPDGRYQGLISFVDPFPALRIFAECPTLPPAAVFWTHQNSSCVLPLNDAVEFFRRDLIWALDSGDQIKVNDLVRAASHRQRAKRILHLSDLHFGAPEAARRRRWLKEQLARELPSVDRVVVTGDLFNNPEEPLRESFDEFRTDIEEITKKRLLVIPGNHDVRSSGNALGPFGRKSEYITDLRWEPVVIDSDLQTVFLSFNSSESGNFAKGAVGERQRLDRSVLYDREERQNPSISNFMKVALVHHHPYAYSASPATHYEKILKRLFGSDEPFLAFEGATEFMQWCAARGVSLVLHGHKHVPHLVKDEILVNGRWQRVIVVGCGSTTGVGGRPMCYDIIAMDPATKQWNALFYHDEIGDGSGFRLQNVTLNLPTQA
jgi:predicted phosphodiesterase